MLLNKYARTHESVSKSLVHVTAITLKLFTKHFSIQRQKKNQTSYVEFPLCQKQPDLDGR